MRPGNLTLWLLEVDVNVHISRVAPRASKDKRLTPRNKKALLPAAVPSATVGILPTQAALDAPL